MTKEEIEVAANAAARWPYEHGRDWLVLPPHGIEIDEIEVAMEHLIAQPEDGLAYG